MFKLTPFSFSGLLIVLTTAPSIFLLIRFGKNQLTKIMMLELISIFGWGLGSFLIGIIQTQEIADTIWAYSYCSVLLIPIFFLHCVYILLNKKIDIVLIVSYTLALYFILVTLTNKMFPCPSVYKFDSFYFHCSSNNYLLSFLFWIFFACYSHGLLYMSHEKIFLNQKNLLIIFSSALPLGFGGGAMNFLPGFNIDIYPYGNFLVPIYCTVLTYVILKSEPFKIVAYIKKGFAYSVLLSIISLIYLVTILILERKFQDVLNYQSFHISILIAFLLGFLFIPLKYKIQKFFDIFFFKGSQEEIASENEKLRKEVAQTEKYKTLATLASGIAHEIRNPLTVIKTFTEYLPARHTDSEFINKYSRLAAREVDRISELVNRLMEYSKPNPPKFTQVSLRKLLNQSIDTMNHNFLSRHVQCTSHINIDDQLTLKLDENQIHQALLNIMLNAVDAMPDGGQLTIGADVFHRRIKSSVQHDRTVQISIKDTGIGIPEEQINQIFDPFFTNKDFGTGLGLAIVQSIIEGHHGKISVKSKIGTGTEVIIELPVDHCVS